MQMKRIHSIHPMREMTGLEQDRMILFPKDVSLSSMLVIEHEIHCTKHISLSK